MAGFMPQVPTNPVLPFNKPGMTDPRQLALQQALQMLLGGLGGRPASMPLSPSNALGAPEPQAGQLETILGGLNARLP